MRKDGFIVISGCIIGNILHLVKLTKISPEEEQRRCSVSAKSKWLDLTTSTLFKKVFAIMYTRSRASRRNSTSGSLKAS